MPSGILRGWMRSYVRSSTRRRLVRNSLRSSKQIIRQISTVAEAVELRSLLSAVLPAYVNGQFTFGDASSNAPYGLENTFALESKPDATKTIYLDFDGHHSVNNGWGHDIQFPAFNRDGNVNSFSDSELIEIQKQFQHVAEDFLPFDVNVTTADPGVDALVRSGNGDDTWGVRAINTQATDGFGNGIGGVAYLRSFDSTRDTPVFTFNKGVRNGGMTNSHEVGHALGLVHDGLNDRTYHPGSGSGDTGWGPILGAPFGKRVTQWSNGDYVGATSSQEDLEVITNARNGFGFRVDDHGDDTAAASALSEVNDISITGWGIIEQRTDQDWFSFSAGAGPVSLNVNAFGDNPNLDVLATLHDADGNVIASSNPLDSTDAELSANVDEGTYFVSVDGVGRDGRYSDYGSLGFFSITGTRVAPSDPDGPDGPDDPDGPVDPPDPPRPAEAIGEAGTITDLDHRWQTIELSNEYENPAVVFGPLSYNGSHESTVRVRNVTSNSFEVRIEEWKYLDGWHTKESVGYVVVESGVHTLPDGSILAAGVNPAVNHRWENVSFGHDFDNAPIVLSQTTSRAGGDPVVTRQRNTTGSGFSVRLQEEERQGSHMNESVAWIAIDASAGSAGDAASGAGAFETVLTGNSVTHRTASAAFSTEFAESPVFVAAMQTFDGGDTANLRHRNLDADGVQFWVDEEKSRDSEVQHTTEVVGGLAIAAGDILAAADDGSAAEQLPLLTFVPTDGTLGEGAFMESGHAGHDHDHHGHDHGHGSACCCDSCISATVAAIKQEEEEQSLFVAFSDLADSEQLLSLDSESSSVVSTDGGDSFRDWADGGLGVATNT